MVKRIPYFSKVSIFYDPYVNVPLENVLSGWLEQRAKHGLWFLPSFLSLFLSFFLPSSFLLAFSFLLSFVTEALALTGQGKQSLWNLFWIAWELELKNKTLEGGDQNKEEKHIISCRDQEAVQVCGRVSDFPHRGGAPLHVATWSTAAAWLIFQTSWLPSSSIFFENWPCLQYSLSNHLSLL